MARKAGSPSSASKTALHGAAARVLERLEPRTVLAAALPTIVDGTGELILDSVLPKSFSLYDTGAPLSKPSKAPPEAIAVAFLQSHAKDFDLTANDVASPIVTDHYADDLTGIAHVYLRQSVNGLPVIGADIVVNLMPDGSVISAAGSFVKNATAAAPDVTPKTSAASAVDVAARQLALAAKSPAVKVKSTSAKLGRRTVMEAASVSQDAVAAELRYVPAKRGLELAWNFALRTLHNDHWYDVAVGDASGEVVFADDWTDSASYNVIPRPNESPQDGGFAVVTDPQDTTASPFGWHDTNGIAGAEFTDTRGNNVDAHLDRVNDNVPDGTRPDGGAALNFSGYSFDSAVDPTTAQNQAISQVNLFYVVNLAHDITYRYGFNEAAGNFQVNNYGKGGVGNDAVQADTQDGGGTNNANFSTPPDGFAGRMQMYLYNYTVPNRDASLDTGIVYHEFGHGVSNRLTGGPSNSSALRALQSGGMGEGWSDFLALMFLQRASDAQTAAYPHSTYVRGQPVTGVGGRRFPYSYNMSINPLTIDAYGEGGTGGGTTRSLEPHAVGEIWAETLWDMNWNLISKYGFDANLQNGFNPANIKGNQLALRLVIDAMKLQPANPSFKDARDAILQADANLRATLGTPSNAAEIWAAFARRGMGTGFVDNRADADSVTPSFTTPLADPTVTSTLPATTLGSFNTIDVEFDQPMNTSSFSIAADVLSFTGPTGANLLATISGFAWTDSTTLRLNLSTAPTIRGAYTLTLAPTILAADDSHGLDTNRNGTPGESVADRFVGTITFASNIGPDATGYRIAPFPMENMDLVIGAPGVSTLFSANDDSAATISLGTNTFTIYDAIFSTVSISTNGLITFGGTNTSYNNGSLDGWSTSYRALAPLWSDYRTDVDVAGATNSAVLYKLDTANNRLIIEWSDVASYYGTGAMTFQAILHLNTGATPGRVIFNYPDLDIGATNPYGGIGSVGLKAAASPGFNRLLLTEDNPNPWVESGKAVEVALDVTPPKVTAEAFNYLSNQSFSITFSEDVGASLSLPDFTLTNTTTNAVVSNANLTYAYDSATRTATITNTGPILADGNYSLSIASAGVTDTASNPLDGDGDGLIGGNHALNFFVLAGDANHDHVVNFTDLVILAQNFNLTGKNFSQGNFNYSGDGKVDFADLVILAQKYGSAMEQFAALLTAQTPPLMPTTADKPRRPSAGEGIL